MLVCESWRFGAPYLHQTRFVRAHMKNLALWAPWGLLYINPEKIRVWQGMTGYVSSSPYLSAAFGFRMCLCVPGSGHAPALLSSLLPSLHENIIGEFSTQSVLNNSVSKLMIKLTSPDTCHFQRTSWSLLFWCGCSFRCHLYVWWILLFWHD